MNGFAMNVGRLGDEPTERTTLVPSIDGRPLPGLVAEFERSIGADVVGGYDGIDPSYNFGPDLLAYYLGEVDDGFFEKGRIWVLGCSCSEVGCWPLGTVVGVEEGTVTWSHFDNDHRPDRDYSGFGPFRFDLDDYRASVTEALRLLDAT